MSDVTLHACGGLEMNSFDVGAPEAQHGDVCGGCPPPDVPPVGTAALTGVVVVESGGIAVRAASAAAFNMSGCVVVGSTGTGVEVKAPGSVPRLVDTLVMAARSDNPKDDVATQATACFAVCSAGNPCFGAVTGCACAGSANAGFALYAPPCWAPPPYAGNTAHHAIVGVLLHGGGEACAAASGFAAYACSEVAIPSLYGQGDYSCSELRLSRMVAAAAPDGVAAAGGMQCPPDLGKCSYTLSESVLLGAHNATGFLWNAFLEAGPTFPRMVPPQAYYTFDADAAWGGSMRLANVSFVDGATIGGGSNPDSAAPLRVAGLKFSSGAARYFGDDPDPAWRNDEDCGNNTDCTGPRTMILSDEDGTLTGEAGTQVLGNDGGLLDGDGRCRYRGDWNAFVCRGTAFRMLYLESLDPDRFSRRLWPARFVQRAGTAIVTGYMDHLWKDGWTSLLRLNRFGVPVEAAVTVEFTGTMPRSIRMETPAGLGGTVVEVAYVRPELPQLMVGKAVMPRSNATPTPTSPHGTWFWDAFRNSAKVTLQPGRPAVVATLTDLVMVSLDLIVTDAQFWAAPTDEFLSYLAFGMGAPPSALSVISIQPPTGRRRLAASMGRLELAWMAPGASNTTLNAMQAAALSFFAAQLNVAVSGVTIRGVVRSYTSGPLCYGAQCMCPFTGVVETTNVSCVPPPPPPPAPDEPFPTLAVVSGMSAGAAVLGGGIAYGVWWRRYERQPYTYLRRKVLQRKAMKL